MFHDNGPTFCGLETFDGKCTPSEGVFNLGDNYSMYGFKADNYETDGVKSQELNDGSSKVVDLEVYRVSCESGFPLLGCLCIMSPPPLGETYCFCLVRLSVCPSVTLRFRSITQVPLLSRRPLLILGSVGQRSRSQ